MFVEKLKVAGSDAEISRFAVLIGRRSVAPEAAVAQVQMMHAH